MCIYDVASVFSILAFERSPRKHQLTPQRAVFILDEFGGAARCALFSLNALIQFSLPLWCAFVSIYIYMYSCLSHGSRCTKAKFSVCIRCTCTYSNTHCGTSEKCIYIYHFYSFLLRQVYAELLILRMKPLGASLWFSFVFAWFAFKITFLKIN